MKTFYVLARNPITRAWVIKTLLNRGDFSLLNGYTVFPLDKYYPARKFPFVVVYKYGKVGVACSCSDFFSVDVIKPCQLVNYLNNNYSLATVVFPKAAKYKIVYTDTSGHTKDYLISNPIEETVNNFTTYAFKHGIRTFIKTQVRSFIKIS